ncbi:MAG: ribbon-helix-helix domain-containing protein [Pseudomonadota bacterium]
MGDEEIGFFLAMRKRSITLKGHRTSIALEAPFWERLDAFAAADGRSLPALINEIDRKRLTQTPRPGLASAIRVYVLNRIESEIHGLQS